MLVCAFEQESDNRIQPAIIVLDEEVTLERLEAIARDLAQAFVAGDLILLHGPLGSGKTALVREVAAALDVVDPVRSPSFTLANVYRGTVTVNHLDLYRLDSLENEDSLALDEYLSPEAITFVEWPEVGGERFREATWLICLDHRSPETRRLVVRAVGAMPAARWARAHPVDGNRQNAGDR